MPQQWLKDRRNRSRTGYVVGARETRQAGPISARTAYRAARYVEVCVATSSRNARPAVTFCSTRPAHVWAPGIRALSVINAGTPCRHRCRWKQTAEPEQRQEAVVAFGGGRGTRSRVAAIPRQSRPPSVLMQSITRGSMCLRMIRVVRTEASSTHTGSCDSSGTCPREDHRPRPDGTG